VGQTLVGAIATTVISLLGLVLALLQFSFVGVLYSIAGFLFAAALWRLTIYDVQRYLAAMDELEP